MKYLFTNLGNGGMKGDRGKVKERGKYGRGMTGPIEGRRERVP